MVEPYFNMWLRVNKAERNTASTIKWFCKVWQNMKMHERFVISLFFLLDFAMIVMGVFVQFNLSFLFLYGLVFMLLLILMCLMNYTFTSFHRRLPDYSVKRSAPFSQNLLEALREVGLVHYGQIELVRDEAAKILDRKERNRASIVRYTFDVVVVVALAATINNIANLLDHGASLNVVIRIVAIVIFAAMVIIPIVYGLWAVYDRLGPLPTSKLRSFVDDLTSLMIYQVEESLSYRSISSRAVIKRVQKQTVLEEL